MKKILMGVMILVFGSLLILGRPAMAKGAGCCPHETSSAVDVDCQALCCQIFSAVFLWIMPEPVIISMPDVISKPFLYAKTIQREVFRPPRHAVTL